jgi:hypothetical protein
LNKIAFLCAIVVDFCVERLQGFGVVSAEILQFYFGENRDEAETKATGQRDAGTVSGQAEEHHQFAA